jgi:membrane-bound ClpP family serine protease
MSDSGNKEDATVTKEDRLQSMKQKKRESLLEVLLKPQVYKPLIILLFVFLFQQFSGCYILIFYTINILRNLSLNFSRKVNENMALMLLGMLRLIMSVIASGYESLN